MKYLFFSFLALCYSTLASCADFNILKYGAKTDTTKLSTKALQRAIDDCEKAGGGCVVVPAGNYKIGSIFLKSNVHLQLELGATLYGSTNLKDYIPVKPEYVSLRTQTNTIQLIYANKVKNVRIEGPGKIDGQGYVFKKDHNFDEGITRPHLIRFIESEDITLKDITLMNSGCWMQHYLACDRLRLEGVTVINRRNPNNDGLDLDGCHDVLVTGMVVDSDDDGITLKSTSPRLCENIRIADCIVSSHCNAVKLGTETNGGFRNINISGINVKPSYDKSPTIYGRNKGISALSLEIVDGGVLENVNISDFVVEGTETPIFIRLGNRGRGYQLKSKDAESREENMIPVDSVGRIRDICIDNFLVKNAGSIGCSITGLLGHPVENINLSNISIVQQGGITEDDLPAIHDRVKNELEKGYPEGTMWGNLPAKGFFVRHARNIKFSNISVRTERDDVRPVFLLEDVED